MKWVASKRKPYLADPTAVIHKGARMVNNLARQDAICIGAHTHVKGELLVFGHGGEIRIGSYSFVGEGSRIWSAIRIEIGDRVLISHGVNIFDSSTHPINPRDRHEQFKQIVSQGRHPTQLSLNENPVRIEDDVLVACASIILSGVTIGRGAIIGAGSVVTADVPPFTIVAGNPAKVIRELTPEERA